GLMGIMFFGDTRFKKLGEMLEKVRAKKAKLTTIILLLLSINAFSQENHVHSENDGHGHQNTAPPTSEFIDSLINETRVSKDHAAKFGELIIQDNGRMKPINTFASELLRKMSKSDTYKDMDANQFLLSVLQNPLAWYYADFMHMKKGNDSLRKIIGVDEDAEYIKVIDFFDKQGRNKIEPYLDEAYATNTPNQFQKDFKNAYERLWLFNNAQSGEIVRIYPVPDDENNKWISSVDLQNGRLNIKDSLYSNFVKNSIPFYLMALREAKTTGDYSKADKILEAFKKNQLNYASEVLPSEKRIKAEVLYNKYDIFKKLYSWYMYAGGLMFLLIIFQIF